MLDHERLDVYRASIDFLTLAHESVVALPRGHAHLTDQLRRASLSIAINIGEGNGKRSLKDRARYFEYSRGSAMECGALFDALHALRLMEDEAHANGKRLLIRIVSMLTRLE